MRVLIVDGNLVYAKKIKSTIEEYMQLIEVDTATNAFIAKRRLRENHYDLIIADLTAIIGDEILIEELKAVNVPTIIWTLFSGDQRFDKLLNALKITSLTKPYGEIEVHNVIATAVATVECCKDKSRCCH